MALPPATETNDILWNWRVWAFHCIMTNFSATKTNIFVIWWSVKSLSISPKNRRWRRSSYCCKNFIYILLTHFHGRIRSFKFYGLLRTIKIHHISNAYSIIIESSWFFDLTCKYRKYMLGAVLVGTLLIHLQTFLGLTFCLKTKRLT